MSKHIVDDLRVLEGLTVPKTAGKGIKTDVDDPSYTWRDLEGKIRPSDLNPNKPTLTEFSGNVRAYRYGTGDKIDMDFHIPHDIVPNSDIRLHLHWGHNDTGVGADPNDLLEVTYDATYSDRDGVFTVPIAPQLQVDGLTIANAPQYCHRVDEIDFAVATPTANQLDRSLIHVDGLVLVTLTVNTIPTLTGGDGEPFIFTLDLHYQSTNIGTKNNASPFYGE